MLASLVVVEEQEQVGWIQVPVVAETVFLWAEAVVAREEEEEEEQVLALAVDPAYLAREPID